jgi:UTP--glucose-1-phosphate uridylyltransferase
VIRKAVVPVAGLGTRLLSATKEQPKEMLPVFASSEDRMLCLKPIVQVVFEQLFDFGIREFCFVVGRGKRAIQDHFTPDRDFVHYLDSRGKDGQLLQLQSFYEKVEASAILWVTQAEPIGFGDAVLQTESVVGREPFLVHAGDTYIVSRGQSVLSRLVDLHATGKCEASLTIKEFKDPRQYGIAEAMDGPAGILDIKRVVEKPDHPTSKLGIMPVYVFNRTIFEALRSISPDKGGELQLTDAIQRLIDEGHIVRAVKLSVDDIRLDIGTPDTYWEALLLSHKHALSREA